jgi:hypothetical protein
MELAELYQEKEWQGAPRRRINWFFNISPMSKTLFSGFIRNYP